MPAQAMQPQKNESVLIVAGGGTGGHVLAGVAVAQEWQSRVPNAHVVFVGARGGIEEKLVPRAGFTLEVLNLGTLNGVSLRRKIKTLFQIPFSIFRSALILLRLRPQAVIGVGGYASGPLVLTAGILSFLRLLHCKTAILEQNSVPGMTNRVLGKIVGTAFCAFPGTEASFPSSRVFLTGNPTRSSIRELPPATRAPFTLFIFGGSQGALGINSLVLEALPHLANLNDRLRFIHQTGERDYDRTLAGYKAAGVDARVEKFIYEMPECYAAASLLICRAGSSTLSEIAAVGRASILVPFPHASDDHQRKNAKVFVDRGAAILLDQGTGKGEELAALIRKLVTDSDSLGKMEQAAKLFHRPNAALDIVRELSQTS